MKEPRESGPVDVLLVVPPFASTKIPCIAASTLRAACSQRGIRTHVFYANLVFGSRLGWPIYETLCFLPPKLLAGERLFSRHAFEHPTGAEEYGALLEAAGSLKTANRTTQISFAEYKAVERMVPSFLEDVVAQAVRLRPSIVGFSITFEQVLSSLALCRSLKAACPSIVTVLGGSACVLPMGAALLEITPDVDFVFSGEGDLEFPQFCDDVLHGRRKARGVMVANLVQHLDSIPYPNHDDYYEQAASLGLDCSQTQLPMEFSRGCWWGENQPCLFCGLNGPDTTFRAKSPERVGRELVWLQERYPMRSVMATATSLSKQTGPLFKHLAQAGNTVKLDCCVRATLSFEELSQLRKGGCYSVGPGIESLSDALLLLLNKGTTAADNVRFLRDCVTVGLRAGWGLLYGIPGEKAEDYEQMIRIFPLIHHLWPPMGIGRVTVERFSPLFGLSKRTPECHLRASSSYSHIFPAHADIGRLATHYEADFDLPSTENGLRSELTEAVNRWRGSWSSDQAPILSLVNLPDGSAIVMDTRSVAKKVVHSLSESETSLLVELIRPVRRKTWAQLAGAIRLETLRTLVARQLVAVIGGRLVSLVTGVDCIAPAARAARW
ncbi:MAG TPA: RiPP maturation radical SAM C-methyltransferase [Verrucomicrobiae bacterium]|nr:RiPP maturation radical SAM C-methyltransferase [Verrucomicrobiae bacterium]